MILALPGHIINNFLAQIYVWYSETGVINGHKSFVLLRINGPVNTTCIKVM